MACFLAHFFARPTAVLLGRLSFISTHFYLALGALIVLHTQGVGTLVTVLQLTSLLLIAADIILLFWGIILRNERGR